MTDSPPVPFVVTREYRRFAEFCDACRRYQYIGLCYGPPGVGKTLSAWQYTRWAEVEACQSYSQTPLSALQALGDHDRVFYTPTVANSPNQIDREIDHCRRKLRSIRWHVIDHDFDVQRAELRRREKEAQEEFLFQHDWLAADAVAPKFDAEFARAGKARSQRQAEHADPARLIVVDEADRLKMASLEQVRHIFDRGGIGLVLIGMPGLEKRLSRYAQLYSRVGFVHEFRPLSATEVRELLQQRWAPPGVSLPAEGLTDEEALAAIIRITGGNFRLLHRLLTQTERLLEINQLAAVTRQVIEAARESLVIGTS